tara:strand:- start:1231 stop:1911 length:681 start_codon:yes stop_codon:yes gene_type:complete
VGELAQKPPSGGFLVAIIGASNESPKMTLSRINQDYILNLTKKFLPTVLDDIGFDPTLKEVGHSFGEKLEEALVTKFVEVDDRFARPSAKRDMADLYFENELINIKFGFKKKGQPNMVAFNRCVKKFLTEEIDSYWILSIDGADSKVCFFNLYEQLDYTNTNLGTGQVMLNENAFYQSFDQSKDYTIDRNDVIMKLKAISKDATESHVELRLQQEKERQEMFNAYL